MVQEFLEKLSRELSITYVSEPKDKNRFVLHFSPKTQIGFSDLQPGASMDAIIETCPNEAREDLFIYLMRANLLGQGTGGARIGLDQKEKNLTLSLGLPYEMNYHDFKEAFEEFLNNLVYWREVLIKRITEKVY